MNIKDLDLNLLRLFDAVWRMRSVSRAAETLDLSQPAASQGLARLRALLGDALFVRSGGGVAPTPRAERLAQAVQSALATLEEALNESEVFDPLQARKTFRMHLSDIGEARVNLGGDVPDIVPVLVAAYGVLPPAYGDLDVHGLTLRLLPVAVNQPPRRDRRG